MLLPPRAEIGDGSAGFAQLVLGLTLGLVAGLGAGYWLGGMESSPTVADASEVDDLRDENERLQLRVGDAETQQRQAEDKLAILTAEHDKAKALLKVGDSDGKLQAAQDEIQALTAKLYAAETHADALQKRVDAAATPDGGRPLGPSAEQIERVLGQMYTLTKDRQNDNSVMLTMGSDTVVEIVGPENAPHTVNVIGTMTAANATDLGRVLSYVVNIIDPEAGWLNEWLQGALLKVETAYTISTTQNGMHVEFSLVVIGEARICMFQLKRD